MLSKISNKEIVKGFIDNYPVVKDTFKEILHKNGFRWNKDWENRNIFGMEGVWFSPVSRLSIRIRWGVTNPSAIAYVEKEFFDKISMFFKSHEIVNGITSANDDYDILNKGDIR